jgi:RNA recognition motif. (a.k.a. RRM, RBD, or RNP domain)
MDETVAGSERTQTSAWKGSQFREDFALGMKDSRDGYRISSFINQPLSVFIQGLPAKIRDDEVREFMCQFGMVTGVFISKDGTGQRNNGIAFVRFSKLDSPDILFGQHRFKKKHIQVKRSLQGYLTLKVLPEKISISDIDNAFLQLGYPTYEVIFGGKSTGIPHGCAAVKLFKSKHQEHVARLGKINILGTDIRVVYSHYIYQG